MKVMLYKNDGTEQDITILQSKIETSGDLRKVARDLTLDVARKGVDYYMPAFRGERGDSVAVFDDDGKQLYRGVIWELDIDSTGTDVDVTCYDSLIYANKSESKDSVFTGKTAEEVTAQVLGEFGLGVGDLAETGHRVRLNGRGKTGYEIMMSAYTEASRANGKKYYPLMNENKVDVIEKGDEVENFIIEYKGEGVSGHLIRLNYKESNEEMVNKIITVSESGEITNEQSNEKDIEKYGLIQKVAQSASDTDAETKEELKLNSGKKNIELECIGDWSLRTGYSVRVKSDELGLDEVLYIESDKHVIANGLHYTSLVLSYENEMDEQEMKENKSSGSGGAGGTVPGDTNEIKIWNFFRKHGFTKEATAAIIGNFFQESRLDPGISQIGGGPGRGLAQWEASYSGGSGRWDSLVAWANGKNLDPYALETQLEWVLVELEQPYFKQFLSDFKNMTDVNQATIHFSKYYEGASVPNNPERLEAANEVFNRLTPLEVSNQVGATEFHAIASEYKTYYQWGGSHGGPLVTDPNARYDCSSFARAVIYRWKGIDIGTYTVPQENAGVEIPISNVQEGDLLFYGTRGNTHHIAIYAGNNKMYEAQQTGTPIGLYNYRTPSFARRVT